MDQDLASISASIEGVLESDGGIVGSSESILESSESILESIIDGSEGIMGGKTFSSTSMWTKLSGTGLSQIRMLKNGYGALL